MLKQNLQVGCLLTVSLLAIGAVAESNQAGPSAAKRKSTTAREVDVPKQAVAVLLATQGNKTSGVITLEQRAEGVHLSGTVHGLEPGKHGFHIHEYGDLRSPDGKSAGGHFNPAGVKHGSPDDREHHVGDLGNITAQSSGTAKVDIVAKGMKLHFVIGRSIVVHSGEDDLKSQPSGDAGSRVAVGVIGFAGPMKEKSTRRNKGIR